MIHGKSFFTSLTGKVGERCGYGSRIENWVEMRGKDFGKYFNPFFKARDILNIYEVCRDENNKKLLHRCRSYYEYGHTDEIISSPLCHFKPGELCEFVTGKSIVFIGIIIGPVTLWGMNLLKIMVTENIDFYAYIGDPKENYWGKSNNTENPSVYNLYPIRKIMSLKERLKPEVLLIK